MKRIITLLLCFIMLYMAGCSSYASHSFMSAQGDNITVKLKEDGGYSLVTGSPIQIYKDGSPIAYIKTEPIDNLNNYRMQTQMTNGTVGDFSYHKCTMNDDKEHWYIVKYSKTLLIVISPDSVTAEEVFGRLSFDDKLDLK